MGEFRDHFCQQLVRCAGERVQLYSLLFQRDVARRAAKKGMVGLTPLGCYPGTSSSPSSTPQLFNLRSTAGIRGTLARLAQPL